MGVQVIPIPTEVVSHSSHSHSQFCVLFPFPWDSRSHWESHSHAHLYSEVGRCYRVARPITRTSVLVVRRCVAKSAWSRRGVFSRLRLSVELTALNCILSNV